MRRLGVTVLATVICFSALGAERSTAESPVRKPVEVKIVKNDSGYELLRDGKPYFIKGAGGWTRLKELAAAGGNSVRTWGAADPHWGSAGRR